MNISNVLKKNQNVVESLVQICEGISPHVESMNNDEKNPNQSSSIPTIELDQYFDQIRESRKDIFNLELNISGQRGVGLFKELYPERQFLFRGRDHSQKEYEGIYKDISVGKIFDKKNDNEFNAIRMIANVNINDNVKLDLKIYSSME